ncbi:MAG: response regulator transcription factor [Anaerolineae bacterium]|nr:response regulator transcription factor [Anaerolineae bacterium]
MNNKRTNTRILISVATDLVILGAKSVLQILQQSEIVATTQNTSELFVLAKDLCPNIILIEDEIDPDLEILTILERLRRISPESKLIVMGGQTDGYYARDLFAFGARSYLYKGDELKECLPLAVNLVMQNRLYLSPTINTEYLIAVQSASREWQIDPESLQVLRLLAQGQHINQVAATMGISRRRVYWVREKLRRRFGAQTNEHMISKAAAEGLLRF